MNNIPSTINISTIGGGTGSSVILRGLKDYTENLSAIITVADDGGSSGILRKELGIIPPGDFRNCVAAKFCPMICQTNSITNIYNIP